MTTNQTIDGVPRAQLADIADRIEHNYPNTAKELRTLLEAPAVERKPFGWFRTPKDCPLQGMFLHYDPEHGERDIQNALDFGFTVKRLYESPAAQPQGEPVAWMYRREGGECLGQLVQMESDSLKDVREGKVVEGYRILWPRDDYIDWKPLYAEQPAPVAVVLPERREIGPNHPYLSDLDIEWNACLDEVTRLNTK